MHTKLAKKLRKQQTPTEKILWDSLRRQQMQDIRFRRQQPVGPYIVDFYCATRKLVIEIDGDVHGSPEHQARDRERQLYLESCGLMVLRFTTHDVMENLVGVLETIDRFVR